MAVGLKVDRRTYSAIQEILYMGRYMTEADPFSYCTKKVASDNYTVTIMEWREWKSQEEKTKWLKILKKETK